jgi:hypothetical protein
MEIQAVRRWASMRLRTPLRTLFECRHICYALEVPGEENHQESEPPLSAYRLAKWQLVHGKDTDYTRRRVHNDTLARSPGIWEIIRPSVLVFQEHDAHTQFATSQSILKPIYIRCASVLYLVVTLFLTWLVQGVRDAVPGRLGLRRGVLKSGREGALDTAHLRDSTTNKCISIRNWRSGTSASGALPYRKYVVKVYIQSLRLWLRQTHLESDASSL